MRKLGFIVCLAGSWAEPRVSKRSASATLLANGVDWNEAEVFIAQLLAHRASREEAWQRAEEETRIFL